MLNILLLILKITGIILAVLIVLLLIAAAVVLFAPVRYRGSVVYKDEEAARIRFYATWILKIVRVRAEYEDGLSYELRVFGKKIIPRESSGAGAEGTETEASAGDGKEAADIPAEAATDASAGDEAVKDASAEGKASADTYTADGAEPGTLEADGAGAGRSPGDRTGTSLADKAKNLLPQVRQKAETALDTVKDLCEKKERLTAFLNDEANRRAFNLLWGSLKTLLAHIRPRRIRGHAVFGFEDPGTTGYALAALSLIYVPRQKSSSDRFEVVPIFDKKIMDIDAKINGRLRLAVPGRLALKIWFDKDFRKLYAEVTDGRK